MAKLLSAFVVLMAISSAAYALKCYNCDSSKGFACDYGLLSFTFTSVECESISGSGFLDAIASVIPMTCAKIIGKDSDGKTQTARGCVPKGSGVACNLIAKTMKFVSHDEGDMSCYTCDSDNCNSAARLGGMTIISLLAASILFLF